MTSTHGRMIARVLKLYNGGRVPSSPHLLMARIDHALMTTFLPVMGTGTTAAHSAHSTPGYVGRDFFIAQVHSKTLGLYSDWLGTPTPRDLPIGYFHNLAQVTGAPPTLVQPAAPELCSMQYLIDGINKVPFENTVPRTFPKRALATEWSYFAPNDTRHLRQFQTLSKAERKDIVDRVRSDYGEKAQLNVRHLSLCMAARYGVYIAFRDQNIGDVYEEITGVSRKKAKFHAAMWGRKEVSKLMEYYNEENDSPLCAAFMQDYRIAFADTPLSTLAKIARGRMGDTSGVSQADIDAAGRAQGCAFRRCVFGPNASDNTNASQRYTLANWYLDPRSTRPPTSVCCPLHLQLWVLIVHYMGNSPRMADMILGGWWGQEYFLAPSSKRHNPGQPTSGQEILKNRKPVSACKPVIAPSVESQT
jgi:hypothetical protein